MHWLEGLRTAQPALCDFTKTGEHLSVFLDASMIRAAVRRLYKEHYFIEDITCLDVTEGYLLLYHFDHFETPGRLTIRLIAPHDSPEVPSIAGIYQGAQWHERECMDYYPVLFTDNPNMSNLLLPDGMQEKPLVKTDKARTSLLDFFSFRELGSPEGTNSMTDALQARAQQMAQAAEEKE